MKVKLCDAFDLQMGKTPSRNDLSLWGGTHKWISIGDIGNAGKYISDTKESISDAGVAKSGIKPVPKGTVIMSFKLSIGKAAITAEDMYTNEAIMAFIDKKKYPINPTYLYYLLSGMNWSEGSNKAVMGLTLNKATLSRKEIIIPLMDEQCYVADALDRISNLIALRKQQLAKLDGLIKARFVEMFGDPMTNPMGWKKERLSELLEIERGGSPRPIDAYITNAEDGVNWIKIGDAEPGSLYITKTKQKIRPEGAKKSRYVAPGDFILSNSMSFGRPYIMRIDGYIHDGWLVLRDTKEVFEKLYLHAALSSDYAWMCFSASAEGGVVNNLNKNLVGQLSIQVPPREIQRKFSRFVEQIEQCKLTVQQGLDKLETTKKALMQQYFG